MIAPKLRGAVAQCLLLVQVLSVGGCAHWEVQPLLPQAVVGREHPSRVRVVQIDSTRVELRNPRVEGGSLIGVAGRERHSIPLDSLAYVSTHKSNPLGTLLLVAGTVSVGLITLVAATYNQ